MPEEKQNHFYASSMKKKSIQLNSKTLLRGCPFYFDDEFELYLHDQKLL